MDKADVTSIVKDEIAKYVKDTLDKEVAALMRSNNSKTRAEMLTTIKNAMESVYKMLWVKRDFWKTDIK